MSENQDMEGADPTPPDVEDMPHREDNVEPSLQEINSIAATCKFYHLSSCIMFEVNGTTVEVVAKDPRKYAAEQHKEVQLSL